MKTQANSKKIKTFLLAAFLSAIFFQTAFATPTTPTRGFFDNGDGTVTQKTTGLTWMRCSMGQTWTGLTCSGSANKYTYPETETLTNDFAGYSDWRLPNIDELKSIVEKENNKPSINTTIFPNTPYDEYYVSGTLTGPTARDPEGCCHIRIVDFRDGGAMSGTKYDNDYYVVRLVRGSQWTEGSLPLPMTTKQNKQIAEETAQEEREKRKEALLQAKREREEAPRRAKEERIRESRMETCQHLYVGKTFEGGSLFGKRRYEIVGYSSTLGKATITLDSDRSFRQEISCSDIPE